jgi:hypothetical protein
MEKSKLQYDFSAEKNQLLIKEWGISFESVIVALDGRGLLDVIAHPNVTKYPNQEIYIININEYVYLVPFVKKNEQTVFLKTIFPSRKLTKEYLHKVGV